MRILIIVVVDIIVVIIAAVVIIIIIVVVVVVIIIIIIIISCFKFYLMQGTFVQATGDERKNSNRRVFIHFPFSLPYLFVCLVCTEFL